MNFVEYIDRIGAKIEPKPSPRLPVGDEIDIMVERLIGFRNARANRDKVIALLEYGLIGIRRLARANSPQYNTNRHIAMKQCLEALKLIESAHYEKP